MFADYTRSFGNVSIQAGIRYEHVGFDYYEKGKHIDVQSRKFDNIFPSLNINFPIGKTQVQLSYAGDITRPLMTTCGIVLIMPTAILIRQETLS